MKAVAFFFPVSDLAMRETETHAVWDVRWYYSFLLNVLSHPIWTVWLHQGLTWIHRDALDAVAECWNRCKRRTPE